MTTTITNIKLGGARDKATTFRNNFVFNSFAAFNGLYLAANEDGLFTLGGDSDNGEPISASLRTHETSFRTQAEKRLRKIYVSVKADDDVIVRVYHGRNDYREYLIEQPDSSDLVEIVVPVDRDGRGVWWSIEILNVNGGYLEVEEIKAVPIVLASLRNKRSTRATRILS